MDIKFLREALKIVNGQVTIYSSRAPAYAQLTAIVDDYYNGVDVVIAEAKDVTPQGSQTQVIIKGISNYMNRPNLPALATFTLNAKNILSAVIQYDLIGETSGAGSWKFSDSFPSLPTLPDFATPAGTEPESPLDRLVLNNSHFIVSTDPFEFKKLNVQLDKGISFAGKMAPSGVAGMFDHSFAKGQLLTLSGPIVIPKTVKKLPPLAKNAYPWKENKTPVGIYLKAELGIDIKFGKMEFNQGAFNIFSLPSKTWQKENPTYSPVLAYTGKFEAKDAGIATDVHATIAPGIDGVMLEAENIKGVSIAKFEDLVEISGPENLGAQIPSAVNDKIKSLQLEAIGIYLSKAESGLDVSFSFLTIGIPDVDWSLIPKYICIDSIFAQFMVAAPLSGTASYTSSIGASLDLDGIPVKVWAYYPAFEVYGELEQPQNLPLKKLMNKYIPLAGANPPIGDLSVDQVDVDVSPGKFYNLNILMADHTPWEIELGSVTFTVKNLALNILNSSAEGKKFGGNFSGYLEFIDGIVFQVNYTTPGDVSLRAAIETIKLSQLISKLTLAAIPIPHGFDLTFEKSSILIEKQGDAYDFMLGTQMKGFGSLGFEVTKVAGQWGFALAMEVPESTLDKIPGLAKLEAFEKVLTLEDVLMVVGSIVPTNLNFLNLAQFNNPNIKTKKIQLPQGITGPQKGFNVYANIDMDLQAVTKLLRGFLSLPQNLQVALSVGTNPPADSKLTATISGKFRKDVDVQGTLQLAIIEEQPVFSVIGSLTVPIQGAYCEFDLVMAFVPNGAFLAGDLQSVNHDGKNKSLQFWVIKLRSLALEIGIDWEGVPSLGFAAQIEVDTFDSSIAVFADSADPAQSLFIGAVSNLSLADVVGELAGVLKTPVPAKIKKILSTVKLEGTGSFKMPNSAAAALNNRDVAATAAAFSQYGKVSLSTNPQTTTITVNKKGSLWYLNDLSGRIHYQLKLDGTSIDVSTEAQIYCVPEDTIIANLPVFRKGIKVDGKITILSWSATVKVDVEPNVGITATGTTSLIKIYSDNFLTITSSERKDVGPLFSMSTYKPYPELSIKAPYMILDAQVNFLGAPLARTAVQITLDGLTIHFSGDLATATKFDMTLTVKSDQQMTATGSVVAGIDKTMDFGKLGSVKADVHVACSISINKKITGAPSGRINSATFEWEGISLTALTDSGMNLDDRPFASFPGVLEPYVKKAIAAVLHDPSKWLELLKKKIIQGIKNTAKAIGKILHDSFGLNAQQIGDDTKAILGYGADDIAKALEGAGFNGDQAAKVLRALKYSKNEIQSAVKAAFPGEHIDSTWSHGDTPKPHIDTPTTPHVDYPAKLHGDIPHHLDTGKHHVDAHWDHWPKHSHTDKHTHIDKSTGHMDKSAKPHGDTKVVPHVDKKPHGDIPVHLDA